MDNVQYICFCRTIFPTLTAFQTHKLNCLHFVKAIDDVNPKCEPDSAGSNGLVHVVGHINQPKTDVLVKILKNSDPVLMDDDEDEQFDNSPATNSVGRRLPSRTKVPYLSRAVPLSTDHSFERCTCGAVFVTRVGKRQHQARFCKFKRNNASNKGISSGENTTGSVPIVNDSEHCTSDNSKNGEVQVEYNSNVDEDSVIEYQGNEGCVIFVQEGSQDSLIEFAEDKSLIEDQEVACTFVDCDSSLLENWTAETAQVSFDECS